MSTNPLLTLNLGPGIFRFLTCIGQFHGWKSDPVHLLFLAFLLLCTFIIFIKKGIICFQGYCIILNYSLTFEWGTFLL